LLDIYDAKTRIIKEISKYYLDFRAAKQNLVSIFAIIQQYDHFPTLNDLIDKFESGTANIPLFILQQFFFFDE
jgi:hypothetical protein